MEVDMDVIRAKATALKQRYSLTKHILGFATVAVTMLFLPFIRIILKANGLLSVVIATIFWVIVTRFGFSVILYPWWLVVAKSLTYYSRLRIVAGTVVISCIILAAVKSILAPADLYRFESDSDGTTLMYRAVATLYWVGVIGGSFVLVPLYVRRTRLLKSKSWTLYTFVLPFVALMLTSSIWHEWGADSKWMSYSIPFIPVFFVMTVGVEFITGAKATFDEAYIMVAGFLPYWLGSVLGKALLTIFKDLGPLGSLFIFGAWKGLIVMFEVLSSIIGKKASRYNDGSVFSFCAIYTGAIYAEFIFQTVEFNSLKFWVLIIFRFLLISVWQGGFKIVIASLVVEHFSSEWWLLRTAKRLTLLLLGGMPADVAERSCAYTFSNAPPDVELAFIRSRAVVVQDTWMFNDIKMASDFQAVACAAATVTADFVWSYLGVGENMIKGSLQYKRGVLMIYVANIATLLLAQALARKQLHSKVVRLKKDMSAAVAKFLAFSESQSYLRDTLPMSKINKRRLSDNYADGSGAKAEDENESVSSARDDDDAALNELKNILDMTDVFIPQQSGADGSGKKEKRGSGISFFEIHSSDMDNDDQQGDVDMESDDWGDDIDPSSDSGAIMKGYVKLKDPKSSKAHKRYVVLNSSNQLLYYNSRSDVADHVGNAKGIIKAQDVSGVQKSSSDEKSLEVQTSHGVYELTAYTESERVAWHDALSKGFSPDVARFSLMEEGGEFSHFVNPLASPERKKSIKRSSLGGGDSAMLARLSLFDGLPVRKGYLKKKNKIFWEERWFDLEKSGVLSWYKTSKDTAPRGSLRMKDVISVQQLGSDGCSINIDVKGRTYELLADSEGLAAEWTDALISWVGQEGEEPEEVPSDEHKPLVSKAEVVYNEGIGYGRASEFRESVGRESMAESGRKSCFESIHDRPRIASTSTRSNGRRSSFHIALMGNNSPLGSNATIPAEDTPVQDMHGWVRKRGASSKAWQRRWVEVLQPGVVYWYGSEADASEGPKKAKGSFEVSSILSVDLGPSDMRCFDINVKGRTYEFQAYSAEEAKYWHDVLMLWMEHAARRSLLLQGQSTHRRVVQNPGVPGQPERSGYLLKRGVGSTRWQSRWFTMTSNGVLYWYKNPQESDMSVLKAKGSIQLKEVLDVEVLSSNPSSFDLFVKGRTYELSANSEQEALEWVLDIFKWMTEFNSDGSNPVGNGIGYETSGRASSFAVSVASTGDFDADRALLPEKSGMVKKKGEKKNSKWLLRYLVLTKSGKLAYYKSEKDSKGGISRAKGVIEMSDVLSVDPPDESSTSCFFEVDVRGRTFQFEAETPGEAHEWCDALLSWVDYSVDHHAKQALSSTSASSAIKAYRRCSVNNYLRPGLETILDDEEDEREGEIPVAPETKKGPLRKKGGSHGVWQERWCEITSAGLLCWFASEKDARKGSGKAKGRIFLRDVISVSSSSSAVTESGGSGTCFDVDVKGRTFEFQAHSAEEAQSWSDLIGQWGAYTCSVPNLETGSPGNNSATPPLSFSEEKKDLQVFEKAGYLKKQGGLFGKAWQLRWFVLRDDELAWYTDENEALQGHVKPKGSILIYEILSIDTEGCAPCCFDINIKGRTIKFQAVEQSEVDSWVEVLSQNIYHIENDDVDSVEEEYSAVNGTSTYNACNRLFPLVESGEENADETLESFKQSDLINVNVDVDDGNVDDDDNNNDGDDDDQSQSSLLKTEAPPADVVECLDEVILNVINGHSSTEDEHADSEQEVENDGDEGPSELPRRQSTDEKSRAEKDRHILIAQRSMSIMPKAWLPGAQDEEDSESSSDDDDDEGSSIKSHCDSEPNTPFLAQDAPTEDSTVAERGRSHSKSRVGEKELGVRRRGSDAADKSFLKNNATSSKKKDTFLNKLKENSAGELNKEFWNNHKLYLFHVMCFVTLHVLYITSFVLKDNYLND